MILNRHNLYLTILLIFGYIVFPSATFASKSEPMSEKLAFATQLDPAMAFLVETEEPMLNSREQLASDVIDFAKGFLGKPYKWGAIGPNSFDCSGFTRHLFKGIGVDLERTSRSQYTQGEKVAKSEALPGDLVFFSGRNVSSSRVGHVGMVVDVDEDGTITFIHAARKGGIRYDKLPDGGYYSNRFIGVKRVI